MKIKEEREKVAEKFKGKLPQYLIDFFDEEELKQIEEEKNRLEKDNQIEHGDKDFWESNKTEIIKKIRNTPRKFEQKYEEPPRADERTEEEAVNPIDPKYIIAAGRFRLLAFAKYYFPHYLKKKSSAFHRFLYETLSDRTGTGAKWAVAGPRGNAKSTVVSAIYPLWCICYEKKRFIVLLSDTAGQAEDFLSDIKRELEHNELLLRDFPHICGKGDTWRSDEIITSNNIKVKALGSGNKIRGRRFGIYRPDLLIMDDIENSEMVHSEVQRTFTRNEWFNKDVLFAGGEEDAPTDFFFVGTILGKYALLTALLNPSEYPDWKSKRFKAVIEFSESNLWDNWAQIYKNHFDVDREENANKFFSDNKEEMLEGTEVLWPEGDNYYSLMIDRLRDPKGFQSEKQNKAVDPTSVYVVREELHWENFSNPKIKAALDRAIRFGALDPSLGKKKKRGDKSAIITLARDPDTGLVFVEDINAKRRSVDDQIDNIIDFHGEFHYKLFGVESNAFQYVVEESLKKRSRELGVNVPVKGVNQYQDKKLRIEAVVPFLHDGTLVFDSERDKTDTMYNLGVEEICSYSGIGDEEDDVPDCLSTAFEIAKKPRFKMIYSQNR